ncbi:MAG: cobalt transporter [Pirellulaceae bacterium]|nr:MAG: cobalt transporter [Pirellulaceae bacterium]
MIGPDRSAPPRPPGARGDGRDDYRRRMYRQATRAAAVGIAVNLALGVVKLAAGWRIASLALISDAVNSLADALVAAVVWAALRIAQRPFSEQHPYGYLRAEAIAASNVALVVVLAASAIAYEAIRGWGQPHESVPLWALGIAATNVLVKESLYQYKSRVGRRTGSTALLANAWDHRSDAFCSLAVLAGLLVVRAAGPEWSWADDAAALLVAAAVTATGAMLFAKAARELLDAQAESSWVDQIRQAAASVPGVTGVEKLWVRKAGLEYFVDVHIEVTPETTVAEGHRIAHCVKDHLVSCFPLIRDVLVHLEPSPAQQTDA